MAILPTASLKNTKHVNLVFRSPGWDRKLVGEFLDWLAGHSTVSLGASAKEAQLEAFRSSTCSS
jgi:hypothetical protein